MIRLNAQESPDNATPVVEHEFPTLPPAHATPPAHTGHTTPMARQDATETSPPRSQHTTVHRIAMRLFWPLSAAICAALAVVATGQLRYRATAQFQVHGSMDLARSELLDFLWLRADRNQLADWNVRTTPENSTINAEITVTDADRANALIRSLADEFQKHIANSTATHSRQPDETERILAEIIDDWQARIATLHAEMDRTEHAIPTHGTADDADAAGTKIAKLIADYESYRGIEIDAMARIDRLVTTPTDPRIDPETRQARYRSREGLQQDTDELALQLTLGRRHLDDVWQSASPALDMLISDIARLVRQGSSDAARKTDATHRALVAELTHPAELYQKRLTTFSSNWSQAFVRMRSQAVDPHAPRLFATQVKLHELLADFSFRAGKLVDTMRSGLQALTQQTNAAEHHNLVTQMRRAFHRFESDHRQFELLASDVYRRNNFRLDATIKSARGLRRRVRIAVETIDAELLAEATARASRVRIMEKREAERQLRRTRQLSRDTIDELLESLALRDHAIERADIRMRAANEFEQASLRFADANEQLQKRQALLSDHLRATQAGMEPPLSVQIIKCGADETPQGLARKLSYALAAGVLAFTAVTFVNRR